MACPPPPAERPLTLAVGDSFTFGDDVGDGDSWPAILEQLSSRRVINAGVLGFGLDQTVLRAEQLSTVYAPDTIVVSFIPDDVSRCEMSYYSGMAKPYFDIDSSGLVYHPAPIPPRSPRTLLKRLLSFSMAINLFAESVKRDGPLLSPSVHHRGREVACLLMQRLAALGQARSTRIVILAQPEVPSETPGNVEIKDEVLACARASHLPTVDLFPIVERFPAEQRRELFFHDDANNFGHMNVQGNRLVATGLAEWLHERG